MPRRCASQPLKAPPSGVIDMALYLAGVFTGVVIGGLGVALYLWLNEPR